MIRNTGGIVMVNFYPCYLIPDCEERKATVQDVVAHINHIRSAVCWGQILDVGLKICGSVTFLCRS